MNRWTLVGIVSSSSYRRKLINALSEKNYTPKMLSQSTEIKFSHISTVLKELSNLGLVRCLTPTLKKNRIYTITKKGRDIAKGL